MLAGAALGLDLTGLIAATTRLITQDEAARLENFAERRLAGEPVARILGVREFWGLALQLSPATLVPRPDTETVVELALEMERGDARSEPRRIADLGTGSGASCSRCYPNGVKRPGVGTDISLDDVTNRKPQRRTSRLRPSRSLRRLQLCGGAVGNVRPDRVEPAVYPLGGYRRT